MGMGRPGEVTQKKVRDAYKAIHGVDPTVAPIAEPYNPRVHTVAPPITPDTISAAPETYDPGPAQLFDTLPDEDLLAIAAKYLSKVDGRWGRERIISELVKAGVDPKLSMVSPPAPIVTPSAPSIEPPTMQKTAQASAPPMPPAP